MRSSRQKAAFATYVEETVACAALGRPRPGLRWKLIRFSQKCCEGPEVAVSRNRATRDVAAGTIAF